MIDEAGPNGLLRHPEDDRRAFRLCDDTATTQMHRSNTLSPIVTHSSEYYRKQFRSDVFRCTLEQTIHRRRVFVPIIGGNQSRHDGSSDILEFQVFSAGRNQHRPWR